MNAKLQEIATRLETSVDALSVAETQARFSGHWSVQQIVEHLTLTYTSTATIVLERLEKNRPTRSRPSLQQHCKRIYVVGLGYFPSGSPAPLPVTPSSNGPHLAGAELVTRAAAELNRLDEILGQASRCFGEQTRSVSHFILGPLNPGEWRQFHRVHGLHHLRQIEEIRRKVLGDGVASQAADPLHR